MGVQAIVVSVVASLAVVAVLVCGAIPDSVVQLKLFAKMAPVWEGEGFGGMASR